LQDVGGLLGIAGHHRQLAQQVHASPDVELVELPLITHCCPLPAHDKSRIKAVRRSTETAILCQTSV
jgi:hypothetical protein